MKSEKRRTFVAREDLLKQINEMAKKNGRSMYESINETLGLSVEAAEKGINLRVAIEQQGILKAARERGFVLGLENLWFDMAELVSSCNKEEALKAWKNTGVWFASRYSIEAEGDPLESFKKDMKTFMWNIPEFDLSSKGENVILRIINPRFSMSYSLLLTSFLEGIFDTLGYLIATKEVSNGSIRLIAVKK
jgi:hypothetical protein